MAFGFNVQCPHLHQLRLSRRQAFFASSTWSISSSDDSALSSSESFSSPLLLVCNPVQVQIERVIPELLDSCGIFHSNNRKAQNSSLEIRNPEMRLIKYICLICSPLHLTSHGSCGPKDNFFKNRSKMADELNI